MCLPGKRFLRCAIIPGKCFLFVFCLFLFCFFFDQPSDLPHHLPQIFSVPKLHTSRCTGVRVCYTARLHEYICIDVYSIHTRTYTVTHVTLHTSLVSTLHTRLHYTLIPCTNLRKRLSLHLCTLHTSLHCTLLLSSEVCNVHRFNGI